MLARVRSAAVLGIDAYLVDVETDIANGLPTFATVGLPQGAVKEGRERVYAALANTGYTFPLKRITVNLAPADIRKDGSAFDLPIAVGILAATEQISAERLGRVAVLGELGLEGAIRPGSGKTMLARRLPTILPQMSLDEALETTKIHSVAGVLPVGESLVARRPFRAPHHTISDAGLIGGGSYPRPGEVSLAHGGVLFLDELPEFRKNVLEVLRQPMEDGVVTIARAAMSLTYPARFMLAAAMNPCPCGYFGDPQHNCVCGPLGVERYLARVSGPLLDRIDIHLEVPAVKNRALAEQGGGEPSEAMRERLGRPPCQDALHRSSSACPTMPSGSPAEIAGVATTYSMTPANGAVMTAVVSPKKSVTTPITVPFCTAWPRSTRGYQIPVPGLRRTSVRSNHSGCRTSSTSPGPSPRR